MATNRYTSLVYDSARWEDFELRPRDLVGCTPPKCGTTWTQMICPAIRTSGQLEELLDSPEDLARYTDRARAVGLARAHRLGASASAAMTVMVALLRGVNVGGKGTLPMAKLREVAEGLGYDDVATYIQSGNLVLRTSDSASKVEKDLAAAIAALGGVKPAVMVRTRAQLARVVSSNPFLERGDDAGSCHVVFAAKATKTSLSSIDLPSYAPEEAVAAGNELYLFLPDGVGRSKLAAGLAKDKAAIGTMRNWRTVTKLLELATASQQSG